MVTEMIEKIFNLTHLECYEDPCFRCNRVFLWITLIVKREKLLGYRPHE